MISIEPSTSQNFAIRTEDSETVKKHEIIVASVFKRILLSPLVWTTATVVTLVVIAPWDIAAAGIALVAGVSIACRKRLVYEISLSYGYLRNKISPEKWPSYSKINDMLFLGRLPLKNTNDHLLLQKEGVGAILSLVEDFENQSLGILSDPVTPDDWKSLGIDQLQIKTADFSPLSTDSIKKGVEYIEKQEALGKKVYVHCKAGRTRSAAVIVAYLRKTHPDTFKTVEESVHFVQEKRPFIKLKQDKLDIIKKFVI